MGLTTLQLVAIIIFSVAAIVIVAVCIYVYRTFCRKQGQKTDRVGAGTELDTINDPNKVPDMKNTGVGQLHEKKKDSSILPLSKPSNVSLGVDSISTDGREDKSLRFRKIRLSDFSSRLEQMHSDNNFLFQTEFDLLNDRSTTLPADRSSLSATAEENIMKNRFVDILPYEENRVKLNGISDFINASFIDGFNRPKEYIATQGPISEEEERHGQRTATTDDFWAMVWQYNCTSIVMLTQCVENSRHKCGQYWPSHVNGAAQYGDIIVQLVEAIDRSICVVRKISLIKKDEARTVTQWHFTEWKDAKAPNVQNLLQFINMVRVSPAHKSKSPTIVHGSAGVGRPGTYIALDCLLQHVRHHDDVDVLSFVRTLRSQRVRMVQTLQQYVTLYDSLALAIKKDFTEFDRDSQEGGFRSTG